MTTTERDAIIAACEADTDCTAFWAAQDAHFEALRNADFEAACDRFEAAYDKHIEDICCDY